jgi:hypothetical protein
MKMKHRSPAQVRGAMRVESSLSNLMSPPADIGTLARHDCDTIATTRRGPGLNQFSSSRNLFIHAAGYPAHTSDRSDACGLQVQDRDPYGSTLGSVKESYVLLTDSRRRREP